MNLPRAPSLDCSGLSWLSSSDSRMKEADRMVFLNFGPCDWTNPNISHCEMAVLVQVSVFVTGLTNPQSALLPRKNYVNAGGTQESFQTFVVQTNGGRRTILSMPTLLQFMIIQIMVEMKRT